MGRKKFFINICTILNNKWPNFWYLKILFQLNVFIGCILHISYLIWVIKEFCHFSFFCIIVNNKWPNFWYLKFLFQLNVFIGCIYHISYSIWVIKQFFIFFIFENFLAILQISWNFGILWPKKINPIFKNPTVDMDF